MPTRFPNINYLYWRQKNEYFSDAPLIETIRIELNHARKGELIDQVIKESNIKTNKNLVDLIESNIKKYQSIESFENNELLLIFDLIQGWGGKTCRNIYVQPKKNPTRYSLTNLPIVYRNSIKNSVSGNYQAAIKELTSIRNLGESFATKHIFFWSEYGPSG
jgi:hypothetical protein